MFARRLALSMLAAALGTATFGLRAAAPTPVLVELFTSEGCSSCPPADDLLARMAASPVADAAIVVPLGEHVDYWDALGWRDRFSSASMTARQQQYAVRLGGEGPYTPQLVIDGRAECVGSDAAAARRAIATAAARPHGTVTIDVDGDRVRIAIRDLPQRAADRAEVLLAVTEDRLRSVVTRGENHGRTLTHAAVVRQLGVVGEAVGASALVERAITIAPDWHRDALHVAAFVQERRTGAVLASAAVPMVSPR